jgi:hypothetical protein
MPWTDDGAAAAISKHSSLFAAGIISIEGAMTELGRYVLFLVSFRVNTHGDILFIFIL